MTATISIPIAGSRKLGNPKAQPSWRTAASASARASSNSERLPSAKNESGALQSATGWPICHCCDANVAVQTDAHASLRFSFCNFVANCTSARRDPSVAGPPPSLIHALTRSEITWRTPRATWHAHCKAPQHNNADSSVGQAATRTREGDAKLRAHLARDDAIAIGRPPFPKIAPDHR